MRARYYDADTGRFIKEDPIGIEGGLNVSLYGNANPVVFVDPSGLFCLPCVTGLIGAVTSGGGNLMVQVAMNGWDGVDWGDALIAAGVGALAGAATPFFGTGFVGTVSVGGVAGGIQYAATQFSNGESLTPGGLGVSVGTGFVGGAISGPVSRSSRFDTSGRFLDASTAKSLNTSESIAANVSTSNAVRSTGAGVISNADFGHNGNCY